MPIRPYHKVKRMERRSRNKARQTACLMTVTPAVNIISLAQTQ